MKALVGLIIITIAMSSCMHPACATYSGAKGRTSAMATSKKSKAAKNQTPYYKVRKFAEKD